MTIFLIIFNINEYFFTAITVLSGVPNLFLKF